MLDQLAAIVGADRVRSAAASDAVSGVDANFVVQPSSTAQVSEIMRATGDCSIIVRGHGTKLAWGNRPATAHVILDLSTMDQVVEYSPGDLITIVQPGLPMTALQERLAGKSQRFALDDPTGTGTIGGTVVANVSGPRRLRFGSARDLVIGVTIVLADGTVAKAGGKVVKNVAGYDLMKLMIGSYGTLAVVTELALRLHPVPAATRVVAIETPDPDSAQTAALQVVHAQGAPAAVELDWDRRTLYVVFEGAPDATDQRAAACASQFPGASVGAGLPPELERYPFDRLGLKLTFVPNGLADVLNVLDRLPGARIRGQAGSGVLYAGVDSVDASVLATLRELVAGHGGSAVVLGESDLDVWGPVGPLELMRGVKAQFDPGRRLAPGRFVGGI